MPDLLEYNPEDLSCNIATLVYNKYLIDGFGINSCNINYTEGDLIEKLLVKTLLDAGYNCDSFPPCIGVAQIEDIGFITAQSPQSPPLYQKAIPTIETVFLPAGKVNFEFIQTFPSNTWKIAHNLGYIPRYTCLDPYGMVINVLPQYSDRNIVILNFPEQLRGRVLFY